MKLGQLIKQLESIPQDLPVYYDFCDLIPTKLDSWRGSYAELALGFDQPNGNNVNVEELLKECRSAIGKTFEGYKGGNYTMNVETRVWISNYGEGSHTGISHITDEDWCAIIHTKLQEF